VKPVSPSALLALVEQELAARAAQQRSGPARRWARKQVAGELAARVAQTTARILDVSYGGLRFVLPRETEEELPASFNISLLSTDLSVQVDLVWSSRSSDGAWLCGAALSDVNQAASRAWCGLVDALA
jgi:hypothetical protein